MQAMCTPLDTAQLLRDILKTKEQHHQGGNSDNNSSRSDSSDGRVSETLHPNLLPVPECQLASMMLSPLLHHNNTKTSAADLSTYTGSRNGRQESEPNDLDNDAASSSAANTSSLSLSLHERDEFDDADCDNDVVEPSQEEEEDEDEDDGSAAGVCSDRRILKVPSPPASANEDSKEAKRAHVDSILWSMQRQSPAPQQPSPAGSIGSSASFKRQKRKQPQPQQHEASTAEEEDEIRKRSRLDTPGEGNVPPAMPAGDNSERPISPVNGHLEDDDTDLDEGAMELTKSSKSSPASTNRAPPSGNKHAPSPQLDTTQDSLNSSDVSKSRQKRKQTQPQQHDNGSAHHKVDGNHNNHHHSNNNNIINNNNHEDNFFASKHAENALLNASHMAADTNMAHLFGAEALFRKGLYRGLGDSFHPSLNPALYQDNLFRHSLFGLRPDLDPVATFRNLAKNMPAAPSEDQGVELAKIAATLKSELRQAVNKAIDTVVSKVLSEKQSTRRETEQTPREQSQHLPQQQLQQSQSQQQQQLADRQSRPKSVPSPKVLPNFLLPHHAQQLAFVQQQQHHQQLQQNPSPPPTERELRKEAAETDKKPNIMASFSDHLHSLERFGSRLQHHQQQHQSAELPAKLSAFDPVPRGADRDLLQEPSQQLITPHTGPALTFHPHLPSYYFPSQAPSGAALPPGLFPGVAEPEQTEALPLIVSTPKKKRTKVTDTRLASPRSGSAATTPCSTNGSVINNVSSINTTSSTPTANITSAGAGLEPLDPLAQRHLAATFPHFLPPVLPTSVAIANPSLGPTDLLALRMREAAALSEARLSSPPHPELNSSSGRVSASSPRSPRDSPHFLARMELYERGAALGMTPENMVDVAGPGGAHPTSVLTPMHLRKAKLMFFYTRYPSSSILKMYFPDVMFNKNNTAQLVKWFSNFREFFYIQMEKYARQALAEGVTREEDLIVTTDSELFRHLNLHYNRNNQIEVPQNFLVATQAALREFFKSIQAGKDAEPSWKKAIYKIIARMDETLPDFFKAPNWMEQLGDQ